jgi:DNA polymerase-3 subunit delta'
LAIEMLRKALRSKRIASAYLFHGPDGVGKSLAASDFAKGLVCEKEGANACGLCSSCRRVDSGNHPDVHWYRPMGKMRLIKIDTVRELIAQTGLKAFEAKWKVFILVDADRMKVEGQNALLKTLEEPPGQSVLILISSNPAGLLPTIISRCQEICFLPIPGRELEDAIAEKWGAEPEEAHLVASLACGSMGSAKRLLDRENLGRRRALLDLLAEGPTRSIRKVRDTVEAVEKQLKHLEKAEQQREAKRIKAMGKGLTSEEREVWENESNARIASMMREEVEDILNLLAFWYRDLLLINLGVSSELVINLDMIEPLRRTATRSNTGEIFSRLRGVEEARRGIALNLPLPLCLKVLYTSGG